MKTDDEPLEARKKKAIEFAIANTPYGPNPDLAPAPTYGPGPELKADLEAPPLVNQSTGGVEPGEYGAEGDPYTYVIDNDGSVYARLRDEPGPGAKLDARQKSVVMSQAKSGQLKRGRGTGHGAFDTFATAPATPSEGFEKKPAASMTDPELKAMGWR